MRELPKIDIRPDHWDIVCDILQKHVPQYAVWAFGSRAKWTAKEYSDLDLAIITDKPLSLDVSASLSDDFSESDLPWKVDIVDWASTSESFRKVIERDRVVVQEVGWVSAEWKNLTLGEFVRLQRGHDLTSTEQEPGSVPVMGSAGPNGTHTEAKATGPGVVIGRSGASMGRVHFCDQAYWPHNTCLYVTDFLGNDPLFVYYKLAGLDLARYNSGSAQPSLNRNYIYGMNLSVPDPVVQRKITSMIRRFDDKIDLNRRINQTLEAMAQAIFKSWFVDFDPVKARIAAIEQGQDPLRAAMRAISGKTDAELDQMPREHHAQLAATAALFPDAMEASELGEIPKGWKVVPASALIDFNPKEPLRKGTVAPYLDMASLPTSGSWAEPPVPREFGSGMRFRNGDALLARITPCLENGKSAFIQNLPDETAGWGSTEFIVMRSKKPVPPEYAYLMVRYSAFREHAMRSMTGTSGRQRAQVNAVAGFKVVMPSDDSVWCAFSDIVEASFKVIKSQSESIGTLKDLRDTLLPKLLSGELSVDNTSAEAATA